MDRAATFRRCVLVLAIAVQAATGLSAAELRTAHYDLYVEKLDGEEVGRIVEAAHAELTRFFGRAPRQRLRMEIYADATTFARALRDDGQRIQSGGGYYAPDTRKAYLFVQPTEYFTRHVILHEAAHQFHFLVATGNRLPSAYWYVEGLAEFFAMHNWDGKTLRLGVVPAISLEDYPAKALRNFDALGGDLQGMIAGDVKSDRPEGWALVHYLVHNRPKEFRRLASALDAREGALSAFRDSIGPVTSDLVRDFRRWIVEHQQPWREVWSSFSESGETLVGKSAVNGLALLKQSPRSLSVEIEPLDDKPDGSHRAGVVFGYQSPDDFYLLQVESGKTASLLRRAGNRWRRLAKFPLTADSGRNQLTVSHDGGVYTLTANDRTLETVSASGKLGLNVDGCRARFRILTR